MQAIGATAAEAISRIDFRSLGILKEDVSLLHTRLVAGIDPYFCWRELVQETGSELINRSVTTFWDGITMGGEPQDVGNEASAFALKISLLRAQRSQIASGFTWLTVAMHTVLTILVVFILAVFQMFSQLLQSIMPAEEALEGGVLSSMPSLGLMGKDTMLIDLLHFMVIIIVFVLIFANAISIYSVSGGHPIKLTFYLALIGGISGIVLTVVPSMANMLFGGTL
jgi:archaellum biogenesis protein FlaJ (TadC family)